MLISEVASQGEILQSSEVMFEGRYFLLRWFKDSLAGLGGGTTTLT